MHIPFHLLLVSSCARGPRVRAALAICSSFPRARAAARPAVPSQGGAGAELSGRPLHDPIETAGRVVYRRLSPTFPAGEMVFFIPWRVVAEKSGAAPFGFGGAPLLDLLKQQRLLAARWCGRRRRRRRFPLS